MARLVNKQFNSPIGLYSEQNIRDVIERESQILSNGAVGINFHSPGTGKPTNLQNSAVLRMLEEEESRQRAGSNGYSVVLDRPVREHIKWPPPEVETRNLQRSTFKDVVTPGVKRVAWPPPCEGEGEGYNDQSAPQSQGGPQGSPQPNVQNNHVPVQPQQVHAPSHRYPLKPLDISNGTYQPAPVSPLPNQSPVGYRPATPNKPWAPVHSLVTAPGQPVFKTPTPQYQPQFYQPQEYQNPPQQYQPAPQQYQPAPQQYQPVPQQYQHPPQQYQAPPQQYQPPPQQYQPPPQQYQPPPQQYQPPPQQYQPAPQQYQPAPQQYQPPPQQYQAAPQQYQPPPQQAPPQQSPVPPQQIQAPPAQSVAAPTQVAPQQQHQHQQSHPAPRPVEPPPATITLRQQAPVSQAPPPVVTSQPATATLKGGKHLRGDMKWPPENVRKQVDEENRLRIELQKGPACRPRLVRKDYGPFFAQHALNASYPGYKVPPGTQFYEHKPVY